MSATAHPAYLELIDLIAGGTTPAALIAFRPSREVQERVWSLIEREHEGQLTEEDQQELADYLQLETSDDHGQSPGAPKATAWLLTSTPAGSFPREYIASYPLRGDIDAPLKHLLEIHQQTAKIHKSPVRRNSSR